MKQKKWPKADHTFNIPLYGGVIHLFMNRAKFNKAVEFLLDIDESKDTAVGRARHVTNEKGESIYLIGWFNNELETLVHEICHITGYILDHAGIDVRDSGMEAYCYLAGHITEVLTSDRFARKLS